MRAQLLTAPGHDLAAAEVPPPRPGPGQVLIRVRACAVCRTDLHIIDGELPNPKLPSIVDFGEAVALQPSLSLFEYGAIQL